MSTRADGGKASRCLEYLSFKAPLKWRRRDISVALATACTSGPATAVTLELTFPLRCHTLPPSLMINTAAGTCAQGMSHGIDAALRDSGFGWPRGQSLGSVADSRDNKDLEGQRESPLVHASAEIIWYSLLSCCCIMLPQSIISKTKDMKVNQYISDSFG